MERIFPLHSPIVDKIEIVRSAQVRRAKLYFLRDLKGKASRMKEQKRPVWPKGRAWVPSFRATRSLERDAWAMGFVDIAGVDEVGRGCLAGPSRRRPSCCRMRSAFRASRT